MCSYQELVPENGYVIAETACGHEGDLGKLKQLVDCTVDSGAQIIKFQIFTPQERATKNHPEWEIFNKLALGEDDWRKAAEYARQRNLVIFADIFGEKSFAIAKELGVDGFKIHSEDLLNSFFIAQVAKENKILMIGVGGAHRIEIYNLLNFLKEKNLLNNIVLMTGVQTFPTPVKAHSIEEVSDLIDKYSSYGIKVGFSDHIAGDLGEAKIIPLMALAKGACIIEKHITVNRDDKWEDYQSALNKDEFKSFVQSVNNLSPLLEAIGGFNSYENKYRKMFKKSPAVVKDLKKGYMLLPGDIEFKKDTKNTIPLSSLNLVSKTLKDNLTKGSICRLANIKNKVGGIIVARCTSSRFPNKAISHIQGRETIALLIERIKRCRNLDCVVLATSTDPSDDILEEIARREGALFFRGSLENLSLRFYEAAKHYDINHIVRITGDDILRDEIMIDKAIENHLCNSCEVTFTDNMPYGTSSEIFSFNVLKTILNTAIVSANTEYLEWYLGNDRYFSINYTKSDYEFDPSLRLTLDYKEDFAFFDRIFNHFYKSDPAFTLRDVLKFLKKHPEIAKINSFKTPKYTKKDINVGLKI